MKPQKPHNEFVQALKKARQTCTKVAAVAKCESLRSVASVASVAGSATKMSIANMHAATAGFLRKRRTVSVAVTAIFAIVGSALSNTAGSLMLKCEANGEAAVANLKITRDASVALISLKLEHTASVVAAVWCMTMEPIADGAGAASCPMSVTEKVALFKATSTR